MSEAKNSEIGEPIDRPSIYRTLLIAFVIWSAHFAISYTGVLVFPDDGIARIIAIGAGLIAIAALLGQVLRLRAPLAARSRRPRSGWGGCNLRHLPRDCWLVRVAKPEGDCPHGSHSH